MDAAEFVWSVPLDHPAFAGHFPGRPIVPGVVLLDQALGFVDGWFAPRPAAWQIASCKFLSPVGPGETLTFALSLTARGSVAFTVRRPAQDVASGTLLPLVS